jgi:DNA modification methylase
MQVVGEIQEYSARANWKMLAENSTDILHVETLHPTYLDLIRTNSEGTIVRGRVQGRSIDLGNGHASVREEHSRKPLGWLRGMVRRWTPPGALVLDLWAGLAPMAAACKLEGRKYVGGEIDPDRHTLGCTLIARAE